MSYKIEHAEGFGEFLRFRRDFLGYVGQIGDDSVDVRCLKFGSRRFFLVNHPELIQNVLVTHDWNFIKARGLRVSKPVLGDGLLTSEGELHRRQRRLVQPAFHSARLSEYAATIIAATEAMCERWRSVEGCDAHAEMMRLTLGIVGKTLFGADVLDDAEGIGAQLTEVLRLFMCINTPLVQFLTPLRRHYEQEARQARGGMIEVFRPILDAHRKCPDAYRDMLSMLMAELDEPGTGYMSAELLLDECLTLFLAGHETTANALTWSLYLLSTHPEIAGAVREEIDTLLGVRDLAMDALSQLPRTMALVRETLRLHPPAWVITREAVTPYMLGDVVVPAGSTIMMSPYATQRDPRFWDDPLTFDLNRWLVPAARPRFAFFPFGAGTRVCIGEHFAMMEAVLVLATILHRFDITVLDPESIKPWPQLTLRPKGPVRVRLSQRSSAGPSCSISNLDHPVYAHGARS